MAMRFKNYSDFVKSELKAVPVGIAQSQMGVGTVLVKKRFGGFVRAGNLTGLCANTGYQEMLQKELANVETLKHPFGKETTQDVIEGFWSAKSSGFLGVVVPATGKFGGSFNSDADFKYTTYNITTHYLKDEYLLDIINNGKWKPNVNVMKNIYIINEVVLTSRIHIELREGAKGGISAQIDAGLTEIPLKAGVDYSQDSDGSLSISGVMENGHPKPFAIAFRTAHIVYNNDFTLRRPMELGVLRGEHDGFHISEFVKKDEMHHIGEFFLNAVEDDNDEEEDEDLEPTVVPIAFDDDSEFVAEEF
jgi:hypothetical protein